MSALYQVKLKYPGRGVHVPVRPDFMGERSDTETEIFLDQTPKNLTLDEIALIELHLAKSNDRQALERTGAFLLDQDEEDPLLSLTHEQLDQVERSLGHPNTRYPAAGGEASVLQRVLILREDGYQGDGKAIAALNGDSEKKDQSPTQPAPARPGRSSKTSNS